MSAEQPITKLVRVGYLDEYGDVQVHVTGSVSVFDVMRRGIVLVVSHEGRNGLRYIPPSRIVFIDEFYD